MFRAFPARMIALRSGPARRNHDYCIHLNVFAGRDFESIHPLCLCHQKIICEVHNPKNSRGLPEVASGLLGCPL